MKNCPFPTGFIALLLLISGSVSAQVLSLNTAEHTYESGYASAFYALSPAQSIVAVNGKLVLAGNIRGDWAKLPNTAITGVSPFVSKGDTCFLFTATEKNRSYLARNDYNFSHESTLLEELPLGLYKLKVHDGKRVYLYGSSGGGGVIFRYDKAGLKQIFRTPNPVADVAILADGNLYVAADSVVYHLKVTEPSTQKIIYKNKETVEGVSVNKVGYAFVSIKSGIASFKISEGSKGYKLTPAMGHGLMEIVNDDLLILDRMANKVISYRIKIPSQHDNRLPTILQAELDLLPTGSKKEISAYVMNDIAERNAVQTAYYWKERLAIIDSVDKLLGKSTIRTQSHRIAIGVQQLGDILFEFNRNDDDYRFPIAIEQNRYFPHIQSSLTDLDTRTSQYLRKVNEKDINFSEMNELRQQLHTTNLSILTVKKQIENLNYDFDKYVSLKQKIKKSKTGKLLTLLPGSIITLLGIYAHSTYSRDKSIYDYYESDDYYYFDTPQEKKEFLYEYQKAMNASKSKMTLLYAAGIPLTISSFFIKPKKYKRLAEEQRVLVNNNLKKISIKPSFSVGYKFSGASFKVEF